MGQKSVKNDYYKKGFREGQKQPVYMLSNIPYGVIAVSHNKDDLIEKIITTHEAFGYKVYLEKVFMNTLALDVRVNLQEFTWDFEKKCYE